MMISRILLAATLAAAAAGAAQAHISLETTEAPVNASYKAVFRVGHGCDGAATTRIRVTIPEGVIAVKPMPKPGWTLETVTGPYAKTYDLYGTPVSEGVTEVVWTGSLPDAFYDEFVFRGRLTDSLSPGSTVSFPVVQECGDTVESWTEIPAPGQHADEPEHPAPGVTLLPAAGKHH